MIGLELRFADQTTLNRKLGRLPPALVGASAGELRTVGDEIIGESRTIVPLKTGRLRSSGQVEGPRRVNALKVEVLVGYPGQSEGVPYTVIQHETLWFKHPGGRSAKYLEKPTISRLEGTPRRVAEACRRAVPGGLGG